MDIGFETIGNATIIVHDRVPLLATDPWVVGSAYMGSWMLSHEIPDEQMHALKKVKYIWISHGHPDHLSSESLKLLSDKIFLTPNHAGNRIYEGFKRKGLNVKILNDREWYPLSDRVKVLNIPDASQDAVILIDVNGRLVINMNDASDLAMEYFVKRIARQYAVSFLLRLSGYGDAAMINFFNENAKRIVDPKTFKFKNPGSYIATNTEGIGAKYFIPFSSMHRYQRTDSAWANDCTIGLEEYSMGFKSRRCEILPAFIRWDCNRDRLENISPPENPLVLKRPEDFGDSWSDELNVENRELIWNYLKPVEHLYSFLDFVNFRVGGKDNFFEFNKKKFNRGVTFEVPRNSLMIAVQYEIFDDLLIGNFMKTTLNGQWKKPSLYPDFTPYLARYADNGYAKSEKEVREYMKVYRSKAPVDYLRGEIEQQFLKWFRSILPYNTPLYRSFRDKYHKFKRCF